MKPLSHRLRAAVLAAALPVAFLAAAPAVVRADVKLPAVLSDSMVLQQGQPVPVWGWADQGEQVTVTFAGQTQKATAGDDGKWMVKLQPLTASDQPAELTVAGKNTLTRKDILVGEVWVCSGQSNMEWPVRNSTNAAEEIAAAKHPHVRLFTVPKTIKTEPQSDTVGKWVACGPDTVAAFSAVGYFFGRELHQTLKVPIGLIHTSWGGTPAEAWTSADYLNKDAELAGLTPAWEKQAETYPRRKENYEKALAKWRETVAQAKKDAPATKEGAATKDGPATKAAKPLPTAPRAPNPPDKDPHRPSVLYNGMIAPIVPYAAKGSIWYQGESNAGRAYEYRKLLPTMIRNWRDAWGDAESKFLIVQLANYKEPAEKPGDDAWAELREAQAMTAAMPNNGLAVAIDLADADNPNDIHPKNKQDVGRRLALVALGRYYGKDVKHSGPAYEDMRAAAGKVTVTFKHADGLTARGPDGKASEGGKVTGFQVAGADRKWAWADAEIRSNGTVVVWSDEVKEPAAVRYAWSSNPVANLYNAAGLPAAPFRTDDWPGVTAPKAAAQKEAAPTK